MLIVQADGVVAPRLGLEESTPLVHLGRLRLADGRPLALDRVWLPASIGEPLLDVDFRRTGLYMQLGRTGIPITGGQETVRAVISSGAEHGALGLQPPSAALSVERTGVNSGARVQWRHTLSRADRFAVISTLDRRPGATEPSPTNRLPDLDPGQATELLERGDALLLDVREPQEWTAGHAPQAEHLSLSRLTPEAALQDRPVMAVGRSGNRSGKADALAAAGVRAHHLVGGMKAWAHAGLPVVTDDGEPGTVA